MKPYKPFIDLITWLNYPKMSLPKYQDGLALKVNKRLDAYERVHEALAMGDSEKALKIIEEEKHDKTN